ncbi:CHASE domain-containing protein [Phenylobacterium sp.]|uniref:CHASE domain-containing protein n=1 Tax=Phenylobacterium sp. TaxID=1871053 RepID=UPI0035B0AEC0
MAAFGALATITGGFLIHKVNAQRSHDRFERLVDETNDAIVDRLETYVAVLRAGAGLYAASKTVDPGEFKSFARRIELVRRYPGIEGIGFAARRPAPGRAEDGVIVTYLEPQTEPNRRELGRDLAADPVLAEAIVRSRDSGRPAMSGKVELHREDADGRQTGFLMLEPVYTGGDVPADLAARRTRFEGFVYAPFQAKALLQSVIANLNNRGLEYAVYDGTAAPQNLLQRSAPPRTSGPGAEFRSVRRLDVAGRSWIVAYNANDEFRPADDAQFVTGFAAIGVLATALIAGAMLAQVQARLAAEREVQTRQLAEERQQLLLGELNHRVKNTLATVQSIAAQSLRNAPDLETGRKTFEARLMALSEAHNLLTRDNWRGASLADLAKAELAPYGGGRRERVTILGEPVWLSPNTAVALGMAFHELATNAAKHGALSGANGRVRVEWTVSRSDEAPDRVSIVWREAGGPTVTTPSRTGFGSRLIVSGLAHQLNGDVRLNFDPDGVTCAIAFNLAPPPSTSPDEEVESAA